MTEQTRQQLTEQIWVHRKLILRRCKTLLTEFGFTCPDLHEEISQITMIKAWKGLPGFDQKAKIESWLFRIATNAVLDFLRKSKRSNTVSLDASMDDMDEPQFEQFAVKESSVLDQIIVTKKRRAVSVAIHNLPREYCEVMSLLEKGYRLREVSEMLKIPLGTVKSRRYRAIPMVREQLSSERLLD